MIFRIAAILCLALSAAPAAAQEVAPPPIAPPAEDEGLAVTVTDENAWQNLGIAIPTFATDRDQPTPANSQGTGALGHELARVVFSDLRNNGLFRPVGPDSLPRPSYQQITSPAFQTWRGRSAEMLVHGYVRAGASGQLTVGCSLYDVALGDELARAGCRVAINGRDADRLARVRDEIAAETGAEVIAVPGDVSTAEGREALLAAFEAVDILVNNNGGPPPRDFRQVDHDAMLVGLEANMIAPILLIQAVIDAMVERRFGRIVNITSGSVKMPLAGLDLSSGARAGLTGFVAGVARQVVHADVTINNLLPGAFDTDRIASFVAAQAQRTGRDPAAIRAERERSIPAKRLGDPAEFGAACAFLCSAQAGYITGQSLLIDGGAFPGIL